MREMTLRERLQALLLKRKWTTREAAVELGVSQATVSRIVRGDRGQRMDEYDRLSAKVDALEKA